MQKCFTRCKKVDALIGLEFLQVFHKSNQNVINSSRQVDDAPLNHMAFSPKFIQQRKATWRMTYEIFLKIYAIYEDCFYFKPFSVVYIESMQKIMSSKVFHKVYEMC